MRNLTVVAVLLCGSTFAGPGPQDVPPELPADTLPETLHIDRIPTGLPTLLPVPKDNPLSIERVGLGRRLFFDPVLSGDKTVSCATCHRPDHGFASPEPVAVGIRGRKGRRNSPSLLNRGYGRTFFWDGRAATLEEQAIQPIVNEVELGNTYPALLKALRSDPSYVAAFTKAFGPDGAAPEAVVNLDNIGRALAAFQRTLLTGNSPIDAFQTGNHGAMTKQERQGFWLFESRGRCWKCHSGVNYSDESFHNTGVSFGTKDRDVGRFEISKDEKDRFAFKTPTLRGVALTPPYFHDGRAKTLRDVVDFYNKGGSPDDPLLDKRMKPLGLSEQEITHLIAFLKALSRDVDATPAAKETVAE